jgi:DNA primase
MQLSIYLHLILIFILTHKIILTHERMEIPDIKSQLPLVQVLQHYNLYPNKNKMLRCVFHDDKTASMQINVEKNLYKCHACGAKGDVIQFVQDYQNLTKHEAILKCTELVESQMPNVQNQKPIQMQPTPLTEQERAVFLWKIYLSFRKGLVYSEPAKAYCKSRNLDIDKLEIGFNSGQFYHGTKKDDKLIHDALQCGLLTVAGTNSRTGGQAYKPFGKSGICFPLKNQKNHIVSFYFRNTIVPPLGAEGAKHYYLKNRQGLYPNYPNPETKKLILTEAIIDAATLLQINEIANNYSILACYGTNGLNEEILKAITNLQELEEIIFFFDGDLPANQAVIKHSQQLSTINHQLKISNVPTPENEDINSLLQGHESEILIHLLEQRAAIKTTIAGDEVAAALRSTNPEPPKEPTTHNSQPITFLQQENLLQNLNQQIGKTGIVGEENSRLLLFLIIISYVNKNPIHAIVQGSSGSGKTHIISKIADLMPQEDVLRFTRITESSLYNWGEFDLFKKIIIIEDLDGLKEDALYALRELISNQFLSSSVSIKDKKGNNKSAKKEVKGQFSSLSATTKGELYEDNMNRSFIIAINESEEQTQKIIEYQNKIISGEINLKEREKAVNFIQSLVRNLKHYEVQNSYANKIQLPNNVRNKRRLNEMFQSVIKQITQLNQYQRQETNDNKLITTIEDIENAIEILFESVILKIDELDGSSRQFFEKLKKNFGEKDFTRFEAMEATGFKKSQLQVYLTDLVRLEYLKQFGHGNKGYKYKVSYFDNNQRVREEMKVHFNKQIEALKKT